MNFQDVIRESYDDTNKALKVNTVAGGSGQATVNINGAATIYAVVNTSAVGVQNSIVTVANTPLSTQIIGNVTIDSGNVSFSGNVTLDDGSLVGLINGTNSIGFATVAVSTPTLYAVVNTAAAGIQNSIVTVANTPLDTQILGNITIDSGVITTITNPVALKGNLTIDSGNVSLRGNITLSGSLPAGVNGIGFATVNVASGSLVGNITLDDGSLVGILGNLTIDSGNISLKGNVTLDDGSLVGLVAGVNNIGFATVNVAGGAGLAGNITLDDGSLTGLIGNVTLDDGSLVGLIAGNNNIGDVDIASIAAGVNWLGFATITPTTTARSIVGNVTLDDGSLTGIIGNVTITDAKTFIGCTSTMLGIGKSFIGCATAWVSGIAGNVTLDAGSFTGIKGNVTINPSVNWIGFATVSVAGGNVLAGNVTLDDGSLVGLVAGVNNIGFATITIGSMATVTLGTRLDESTDSISIGGTDQTIIHKNIELSTSSVATIAVGATGNAIFKITNLLINSDATVRLSIKSGPTYLTGNASIGITLNPGGGWVETGGTDSPTYIGLTSGAAIVVEKFDMTATSAKVGGKIMYFQE